MLRLIFAEASGRVFVSKKEKNMNEKNNRLLSPLDGTVVPLTQVKDPVFSSNILGRGFAVKPKSGRLCSPAECIVESVSEAKHAYVLKTQDGVEMLIHIGLETVYLKGKPFNCVVKNGDSVKAGDLICEIDLKMIEDSGADTIVPVTFPKIDGDSEIEIKYGQVKTGDEIMRIGKKKKSLNFSFLKRTGDN